jgi:hypothetical protein
VFNLRWSAISSAAAFAVSLALGFSVRAQMHIIFLRALGFAVAFFLLAVLIWRLINKYIPELLQPPSAQDPSVAGLEPGGRLNLTLGDEEVPRNAALPPEDGADNSLGNIAELMNRPSRRSSPAGDSQESAPEVPELSALLPSYEGPPPAQVQGMDQAPQSGYTQGGGAVSGESPPVQRPADGFPGLGDTSGDVESLPDLDALAGSFLSSPAAGEEDQGFPGLGSSPRPAGESRPGKGKNAGEDFNPKELASAIQTILKRD